MRISALLFPLALAVAAAPGLRAQNPGAQQDAEAAREKLLKAADELDNIQANSEITRQSVDGMKTDVATLQQTVTKLQGDNAALRQQLADLQTSFDQYKADQAKARQALIDNVAEMIASGGARTAHKKKPAAETPPGSASTAPQPAPDRTTEVHTELAAAPPTAPTAPGLAPPPDPDSPAAAEAATPPPAPAAPKPQKGYYHVVADGETVPMIAEAYRENGVKVTAAQIRKANGLTTGSVLKPGQKLFIPKPGA